MLMPVDPSKTKRVALSLPVDVADKVQQLADKERRSVSFDYVMQWKTESIRITRTDLLVHKD